MEATHNQEAKTSRLNHQTIKLEAENQNYQSQTKF
jgi:hypothetical protein